MSDTFTASNGLLLCPNGDGSVRWEAGFSPVIVTQALREFFLHERDKELGRWRWPEKPVYVVYPVGEDGLVDVLREDPMAGFGPGRQVGISRTAAEDRAVDGPASSFFAAARAYFAAHQEPRPWHDAKPGEVWAITTENVADEVAVQVTPEGTFQYNDGYAWPITDLPIDSARRIFPEVSP